MYNQRPTQVCLSENNLPCPAPIRRDLQMNVSARVPHRVRRGVSPRRPQRCIPWNSSGAASDITSSTISERLETRRRAERRPRAKIRGDFGLSITHRRDLYLGHPAFRQTNLLRRRRRQIETAAPYRRTTVVDFNLGRTAVFQVSHS